jgi:iron complex transport system permease protein
VKPLTLKRYALTLCAFGALFIAALIVCPLVGPERIDAAGALGEILAGNTAASGDASILAYIRIPRVILALLAGGALALAGVAFQALLRNPLATPYTLGVASGSALGASSAIYLGITGVITFGPISGVQISSLLGACAVIGVVYLLARKKGRMTMMGLLLAGVTMGLIASSVILFIRYISRPSEAVMMDRWLMGSMEVVGYGELGMLFPFLLPGLVLLFTQAGRLNQLAFGEELAAGRGVNVGRTQRIAFFGGSLVTASVVALTGPIGFVGLIVPHAVRKVTGPDHRLLMPASFLTGGAFLAVCGAISNVVIAPTILPVGIITAMLGGPFFLAMLVKMR